MRRLALIFILLAAGAPSLFADFGDGGDYSGGSSDGSSSSSSSDWGSSSSSSSDWGSSSSSDYGSGGGGSFTGEDAIWLGITIAVILAIMVGSMISQSSKARVTYQAAQAAKAPPDWAETIRAADPNFSRVLFMDFANLVFVKLHEARGKQGKLEMIMPYLAPDLRTEVANDPTSIDGLVVGGRFVESAVRKYDRLRITVVFRANVFENTGGKRIRTFVEQACTFLSPLKYQTPDPDKLMALGCPACGSPEELQLDGRCKSCGVMADGSKGWLVVIADQRRREVKGPEQRRIGHFNKGLNEFTIFDANLGAALRELHARDAGLSLEKFQQRAEYIFKELQQGWAERNVARLRPHLSDGLFNSVRYALTRNDELRLQYVCADINIYKFEVVRIEHDALFDAITARIFCTMTDYALDAQGQLFKGDNKNKRDYSEYWTFLRRSGVSGSRETGTCPSCGAPLDKINMAGVCGYCNAKIVSGNFDWVLAQIDQDEEYRG
jgi:hypothetical protein